MLTDFEQFLNCLVINRDHSRIKNVEMDLYGRLNPTFLLDQLFFEQRRWLGFEEFYHYYLAVNGPEIMQRFQPASREAFQEGLRARLYRTQFGFLTEYHAFLLAGAFFGSENTLRSVALDRAGVDFQVSVDGLRYNIHIFVDTARAWEYRLYKSQHKNVDRVPGIHVNLPYALAAGRFNSLRYLENGFGVYQPSYFAFLLHEIQTGRIRHNNITGTTTAGFIYRD